MTDDDIKQYIAAMRTRIMMARLALGEVTEDCPEPVASWHRNNPERGMKIARRTIETAVVSWQRQNDIDVLAELDDADEVTGNTTSEE